MIGTAQAVPIADCQHEARGYALALNRSIGAGPAFLLLFMVVRVLRPFWVRGSALIALVLLAGIILC